MTDLEGSADMVDVDGSGDYLHSSPSLNHHKKQTITIISKLTRGCFVPDGHESSISTTTPTASNTPIPDTDNTTTTEDREGKEGDTKPEDEEEDIDYEQEEAPSMEEEETPTAEETAPDATATATSRVTPSTQELTDAHKLNPSGGASSLSCSIPFGFLLIFAMAITQLAVKFFA